MTLVTGTGQDLHQQRVADRTVRVEQPVDLFADQ